MSRSISRRRFFHDAAAGLCALSASASVLGAMANDKAAGLSTEEARYYRKLPESRVLCELCPRNCQVADQERGWCGVRENQDGTYLTLVHSRPCAVHVDPIEKKPLFHYLPASGAFSIATAGCNIECKYCQNWDISQFRPEDVRYSVMPPAEVAKRASQAGCKTIAYTYSEPVIFYEYMYDCAVAGRKLGIGSVMITNAFIHEKPFRELCKQLTAVKVDLKAFTEQFYREVCRGQLQPVLDSLKLLSGIGIWTEIVVLVIPTLNDSAEELKRLSGWVVKNMSPDVPVHFTRFHRQYKMTNLPDTPQDTVEKARELALKEGVRYAYVGNVARASEGEQTWCHECKALLVKRYGYRILENNVRGGLCPKCGAKIPGVWSDPLA